MNRATDYDCVVVGAGIAGIACAYYLQRQKKRKLLVIDKLQPMSLTTACSGENFRNFWPQQCMSEFTSHSYDLMQSLIHEFGNVFSLKQTGYEFVSKHDSIDFAPTDDKVLLGDRGSRSYLNQDVRQIAKVPQAGAFDVYALGSLLLTKARELGAELRQSLVEDIEVVNGRYEVRTENDEKITANKLVLAAGPFVNELMGKLDLSLPVESIMQSKFVIPDPQKVIPRDMPFTICADSISLDWSQDEREMLEADPELSWLLNELPAGLHIKPEGQDRIKLGWAFNRQPEPPKWQCSSSDTFPGIVMKGASQYFPGLGKYTGVLPTPVKTFSGYYTRTRDNLPLIGQALPGLHVVAGLSGFGTMAACATGSLVANDMNDQQMPEYAKYFAINRYENPDIRPYLDSITSDGQL